MATLSWLIPTMVCCFAKITKKHVLRIHTLVPLCRLSYINKKNPTKACFPLERHFGFLSWHVITGPKSFVGTSRSQHTKGCQELLLQYPVLEKARNWLSLPKNTHTRSIKHSVMRICRIWRAKKLQLSTWMMEKKFLSGIRFCGLKKQGN